MRVSRRKFLATGGALVVTFALTPALTTAQQPKQKGKSLAINQVDGFLSIDATGLVTVYSGKVELGTGVYTALTQMAAEELSIPLDHVRIIQGLSLIHI